MITSNQGPSGKRVLWLAGIVMLIGVAVTPVHGEPFKYYIWTDENNVVHVQDHPPANHEYETRIVDDDTNVMTSPDIRLSDDNPEPSRSGSTSEAANDEGSASSSERITRQSTSGIGRAVLLEEARRDQSGLDTGPTGSQPPDGASPTDSDLPRSILPETRGNQSGLDAAPGGSSPPDGASPTDSASPASILPGGFR